MYASTKQARAIFKQVLGPRSVWGSWTDKTSEIDTNRRSVSYRISDPSVMPKIRALFASAGFDQSVPKLTECDSDYGSRSSGGTYIRVIAYI